MILESLLLVAAHTVVFDPVDPIYEATYRIYVGTEAPQECSAPPCTVIVSTPDPGEVIPISVVAVNPLGEGPH